MNRTFRQSLMSTTIGTAMAVLTLTGGMAQAQDASTCMQDIEMLGGETSLGKGGETVIAAPLSAAEEACRTGNYGLASAYIAEAERQIALREAQRQESGTTPTDAVSDEPAEADVATVMVGPADDINDDSLADDIEETAEDVDEDVEEVAEDVGDELEDIGDDISDEIDDLFGEDEDEPNTPAARAALAAIKEGRVKAEGEGFASIATP